MILIYDDYNDCWVWVERNKNEIELSPTFETEKEARAWLSRVANIIKGKE